MVEMRALPERLVEAAVYVPVGVVVTVLEELPALADKGRERVESRLQMSRVIGKLAVAEGKRRLRRTQQAASPTGNSDGSATSATPAPSPRAEPSEEARREAAADRLPPPPPAPPPDVPRVDSLPIPGYDTLAASQVVQRLVSLRPDELDAVHRYEMATRGRRTILNRIGQLSEADGEPSA